MPDTIKTTKCIACDVQVFWANLHDRMAEGAPKAPFEAAARTEGPGFRMDFSKKLPMTIRYVRKSDRLKEEPLYIRHRHSQDQIAKAKAQAKIDKWRNEDPRFR